MVARIPIDHARIAEFCRRHHIRRLSLFGSVLRDDFRDDSDVDVLVELAPDARRGWDSFALGDELESLLGRRVDFVEARNVKQPLRERILNTAEPIYGPPFREQRDMSEADKPKDYTIHLQHMLDTARLALSRVANMSRDAFDADADLKDATVHRLQVIGEAAKRIPDDVRATCPGIPWPQIVGMRNRLVHDYLNVDFDMVWDVATNELGPLIAELEKALASRADD